MPGRGHERDMACILAELFGKETGLLARARGVDWLAFLRQAITTMYGLARDFVAAHVQLGVGLAFAIKYRAECRSRHALIFGDGALLIKGSFHEP